MALKATIHKVDLTVSDMDRGYYATHALTIARHPSETEERMMVRLLAFALFADDRLEFGKGLCAEDEADLWLRDLTGEIVCWIDVGQPDEKWIRKACGRSESVVVLSYGRAADVWWKNIAGKLGRQSKLTVLNIDPEIPPALAEMTERGMHLQCTLQDGELWMTDGVHSVCVVPRTLLASHVA